MMKATRAIIMTLLLMLSAIGANAQDAKQRMSREQMAETQARHIAADLNLDGSTYDRFVETYKKYKNELWQTAPKRNRKDGRKASETEEQAAEKMRLRFERSQKVLDIRNKYYREFSKFLTQKQIEQMYDKEHKIMERLSQHRKGKGRPKK